MKFAELKLLSYLTWRDSKCAVVIFVKNKAMSPVLGEIETITPSHPSFNRVLGKKEDSWQNFEFHLPNDAGCPLRIAVLAFHIPQ